MYRPAFDKLQPLYAVIMPINGGLEYPNTIHDAELTHQYQTQQDIGYRLRSHITPRS